MRAVIIENNPDDRAFVEKVLTDLGHQVDVFPDFEFCTAYRQKSECARSDACYDTQIVGQIDPSSRTGIDFIHWQKECGCKLLTENSAAISENWSPEEIQIAEGLGLRLFSKPFMTRNLVDWLYRIRNSN